MSNYPNSSYQFNSAIGASPVGLIVALYDGVLQDLMRGLAAMRAGQVEERVARLNHALGIIGHLQSIIDREQGGESAKYLETFYVVARGMIVDASCRAAPDVLEKVVEMFGTVRRAWYQADRQLSVSNLDSQSEKKPTPGWGTSSEYASGENMEEEVQSHWSS